MPWPGQLVGDHRLWKRSLLGCGVRAGCCHLLPLVTPRMQGSCGEVEGTLGVTGPALKCHSDASMPPSHCRRAGTGRASDARAPVTPCQAEKGTVQTELLEKQLLPTSSSNTRCRMRPFWSRNSCWRKPSRAQPVLGMPMHRAQLSTGGHQI